VEDIGFLRKIAVRITFFGLCLLTSTTWKAFVRLMIVRAFFLIEFQEGLDNFLVMNPSESPGLHVPS
jgi:uncharacterized protein YfbU (UPF0304 family)